MLRQLQFGAPLLLTALVISAFAFAAGIDDRAQHAKADLSASMLNPPATHRSSVENRAGEQINWQVVSSGGTDGTSANFQLAGTVGQTAVGSDTSTNYALSHGFWQPFGGGGGCCQKRGDVNHDNTGPDISDLVDLVSYMFGGQPYPGCEDPGGYKAEADIDGSGSGPDIADLVALVNYMFGGCPSCLVPCP